MNPRAPASPSAAPQRAPLLALACIVALQLAMAVFSLEVLSSVRAYVTGESLYSKAQKDAALHLKTYLREPDEATYALFLQALAVPLGDRIARESLQRFPPDLARAEAGFLQGGNDPADVGGMVRLFIAAQHLPLMAAPIRTWTEGDHAIEELLQLAAQARAQLNAGRSDVQALRTRLVALNQRLSQLEQTFSRQLGVVARQTQAVLLVTNLLVAAALGMLGARYIRAAARQEAARHAERAAAAQVLERRALRQQLLAQYGRFALTLPGTAALAEQTLDAVQRGLKADACAWFETAPGTGLRLAAGRALDGGHADALQRAAHAALRAPAGAAGLHAVVSGADGTHGVIAVQAAAGPDDGDAEFLQTVAHTMASAIERRIDRERLERMAQLDALTGIPNRSLFLDRLGQSLVEAVRDGRPVAVLFIDIDRFKHVNDTLGHAAGDELLVAITQRLGACLRPGDTLGRLGGDEFTVALAHLAHAGDAATVAAKIVAEIARPFTLGEHQADVSASIGIALYPADSRDPETLLQQADLAMYQVKAAGRDGWRFYAEARAPEPATP